MAKHQIRVRGEVRDPIDLDRLVPLLITQVRARRPLESEPLAGIEPEGHRR